MILTAQQETINHANRAASRAAQHYQRAMEASLAGNDPTGNLTLARQALQTAQRFAESLIAVNIPLGAGPVTDGAGNAIEGL